MLEYKSIIVKLSEPSSIDTLDVGEISNALEELGLIVEEVELGN